MSPPAPVARPRSFDHVALWVADRDELAAFLCDHLGMHEISRTDAFTLVGADALQGKLTLFAAPPPREPGVLRRVVLRVSDLEGALAKLPDGVPVERPAPGTATFEGPQGFGLGLVESERAGPEYDIDHVVLAVPEPRDVADALATLGFDREDGRLAIADKEVRIEAGDRAEPERGTLNHLAVLVESASAVEAEARRRGVRIADVVDAANTLAVFVWAPAGIKLEYVEHKPGFSLV
jgi:catechol 2,3-dioxygenase-like lactoylglutathione lyase family enzyme